MKPYYDDGSVVIYHGDAREILPTLGDIDAIVTDPPYGIGWVPRVNHRGDDHIWVDNKQFDPRPFMFAKQHLFWGGNYYAHLLPPTESWFVWMKRPQTNFENDRRSYAMAEMAWSDLGTKPLVKVHVWDGGKRAGKPENRTFCHPSQKPVEVMTWCVAETQGRVVDPFMGSGTTLRAAKDLGRKAVGIEIEERYCEIAAQRMGQEVMDFAA
jgi:DNA modification methylase